LTKAKNVLGIDVRVATPNQAEVVRRTTETEITCRVRSGKRQKWNLDTGLNFLNHMIEELAYFSELNLDTVVKSPRFLLAHTVVEDTGLTLGKAFHELATARSNGIGIRGFGSAQCVLDEAFCEVRVSFEGRVGVYISRHVRRFGWVEDVQEEFLESFFQGFAQSMRLTIHIDLLRADDPHHLWEACFRSFGAAMRELLKPDEWRKGGISGIKGTLD
jgi:imidazoleglycerol-phosphate dehydratase